MPDTTSKRTTTPPPRSQPWVPLPYMLKAVKFLLEHAAAGLFLDPGLRKTSITLAALCLLKKHEQLRGALILAPLRPARLVWPFELKKWTDFGGLTYCVLHGPNKDFDVKTRYDLYIINFEGLKWLIDKGHLATLLRLKWIDTLVVDELSKMKHADTQRFKLLKPFLARFTRRWGLTGSPAANSLLNLFGQAYVLDCGKTFGPYITYFRAEFFTSTGTVTVDTKYGEKTVAVGWQPRAGTEKLLFSRLKPLVMRMAADDYLDLPQIMSHTHKIELPPAARKLYDKMEETLVIELETGVVTAANVATAVGKCRQIASGALYKGAVDPITGAPTTGPAWAHIHDAKLDAFLDLVDELQGQPIFVAYEWRHDVERLGAALGGLDKLPYIGGGVSDKKAEAHLKAWNRNELPYMFGQPQSVGHGLNAQEGNAAHVAFFTVPWDYELYEQFIGRLRRSGNTAKTLHVHHFVVADSVDGDVMNALARKRRGQSALFDALRERLSNGRTR